MSGPAELLLQPEGVSIEEVAAVAAGRPLRLSSDVLSLLQQGHQRWAELGSPEFLRSKRDWMLGDQGDSPLEPEAFVLGHCAGLGAPLAREQVRAMIFARVLVLSRGLSGVRPELVQLLVDMLNEDIWPEIPSQGSVGAAGDLAPLAHLAQVVFRLGGRACKRGVWMSGEEAMEGLPALRPSPKEALALINGATLSAGLGALVCQRARRLLSVSEEILALTMEVSCASTACLDEGLLSSRGHPGAVASAERLRSLLKGSILTSPLRAPDDFSIRCAPAVLGTCWEALEQAETWVLRELNGACDNPLVLPHGVIEGGNFHGAPVGVAMDLLKIALTQLASMSERRTYKMTHGDLSGDLPSFLVESTGLNSGLMLAQYTAASLVSECKGFAHPASVDSIPTGHHHEDHVSMAPIAARSALKCLDCVIAVIAIEALVAAQGADLRCEYGAPDLPALGASAQLAPRSQLLHDAIREVSPRWREDRVLYRDLEAMIAWLRGRLLP